MRPQSLTWQRPVMAYEDAKRLLAQAKGFRERKRAILQAMDLGMPLHEIETFLDGLAETNGSGTVADDDDSPPRFRDSGNPD